MLNPVHCAADECGYDVDADPPTRALVFKADHLDAWDAGRASQQAYLEYSGVEPPTLLRRIPRWS